MRAAALVMGLLGAAVVTGTEPVPAADLNPSAIRPPAVTGCATPRRRHFVGAFTVVL